MGIRKEFYLEMENGKPDSSCVENMRTDSGSCPGTIRIREGSGSMKTALERILRRHREELHG